MKLEKNLKEHSFFDNDANRCKYKSKWNKINYKSSSSFVISIPHSQFSLRSDKCMRRPRWYSITWHCPQSGDILWRKTFIITHTYYTLCLHLSLFTREKRKMYVLMYTIHTYSSITKDYCVSKLDPIHNFAKGESAWPWAKKIQNKLNYVLHKGCELQRKKGLDRSFLVVRDCCFM